VTILGSKLAQVPAAPKPATLFAKARAASPRGEFVTLPLFGRAWIELAGEAVVNEIEGAVFAEMKRLDLPLNAFNALTYESHRTVRTLAWAVRDPDNIAERFGTLDEWLALDIDGVNACGIVYADVRERLDPIGAPTLTSEDVDGIRLAIEKKNPMALRSYGVAKLSLYLVTGAAQPASSPPPLSSSGES
jgi:hypothetical protein